MLLAAFVWWASPAAQRGQINRAAWAIPIRHAMQSVEIRFWNTRSNEALGMG